jgi:hypothetical protein
MRTTACSFHGETGRGSVLDTCNYSLAAVCCVSDFAKLPALDTYFANFDFIYLLLVYTVNA